MSTFGFGSSTSTGGLFGSNAGNAFGGTGVFRPNNPTTGLMNTAAPVKDAEVLSPPEDSIQSLAFSPATLPQNYLVSGSWDNKISCWEIQAVGNAFQSVPKAQQTHTAPVLDVAWSDDGTKIFSASCDKTVKAWDLNSNQCIQVAQHEAPVKTAHWIKAPNYACLMTGSWDKTLKFWDLRTPNPIMTLSLPERVYCADVVYPMAVVGLAQKMNIIYKLDSQPTEYKRIESNLKYQSRCISIFNDKKSTPCGFALGSIEGRVSIQYVNGVANPKENFTFKCHRSNGVNNGYQDIYAVNDIAFHPQHGTLATVGSDGRYSFWDKDNRTKLKSSDQMDQPITKCAFSARGEIFAYAVSYDWSRGHEYANQGKKNSIFLHGCFEDLKPKVKK